MKKTVYLDTTIPRYLFDESKIGQILRSFSLNITHIRLKGSKNLTQFCFPSLRLLFSDSLLATPEITTPLELFLETSNDYQ